LTDSRWKTATIQEFVDRGEAVVKTGPFGTQMHASDYIERGTPVINVRNIGFGSVVPEKLEYIGEETVDRLKGHLLRKNDIVFGRKGAVERHALIRDQQDGWFQGSDCLRLRVNSPELSPIFLSYCFLTDSHQKWMMNQCSHGATMASLNQAIVCRIPLRFPHIKTQSTISGLLSAYDDLIENNARRIAVLEEMALMIYREWFVKFRFPRFEKVKSVQSEMGSIPDGWKVLRIGDVLQFHIGGGWGEEKTEGTYTLPAFVIRGTDIPSARMGNLESCPLRYHRESNLESRRLRDGDIVFEVSGGSKGQPVGRALLINKRITSTFSEDVICASFCKLLRPDSSKISAVQLYLYLLEAYTNGMIEKYQVQSTGITNFKFAFFLEDAKVVVPSEEVRIEFERFSSPFMDSIAVLGRKNAVLRQTRDLLLPKLVSGEISVEEPQIETANQIS
jgi:type I restriction enzyme, S subunit